jgi:hypothetical protein
MSGYFLCSLILVLLACRLLSSPQGFCLIEQGSELVSCTVELVDLIFDQPGVLGPSDFIAKDAHEGDAQNNAIARADVANRLLAECVVEAHSDLG